MAKRKRRGSKKTSQDAAVLRLRFSPPRWRPTPPSPTIAWIISRWHRRRAVEPDDDQLVPGTGLCPLRWYEEPGIPLYIFREIWVTEEGNSELRCHLCAMPLLVSGFSHALFNAGLWRVCPSAAHPVIYCEYMSTSDLHDWLRRVLPVDNWPERVIQRLFPPQARPPESKMSGEMRRFLGGQWIMRPPRTMGEYLTASLDGRRAVLREITLDHETCEVMRYNGPPCWWWSVTVPADWPGLCRESGLVGHMK